MYSFRGLGLVIFILLISKDIFSQGNLPDTIYCEKSYEFLKQHCYICEEYKERYLCVFEKFDYLGKANNKYYYYGVYVIRQQNTKSDYKHYYFIIYEADKKESNLKPVHFFYPRYGGYEYYNLSLTNTKYGQIIHIHLVDDSAGWDDGEYVIYRAGNWERLREPDWTCASEGLIPDIFSLAFFRADPWVKIDLKTMSIKIPVYEGGVVIFNLTVEKDRFGIAESKYFPETKSRNLWINTEKDIFSYCKKTIDFLQNNCYLCDGNIVDANCKLKEFKKLGDHNGKQFYYGLYSDKNDDGSYYDSHFIIYEGKMNSKFLKPIEFFYPYEIIEYYNVEMTNTKYGLIIHIYFSNGNGGFDMGEYIIYRNGRWEKLEVPDWDCVYEWVIPEDTYFCRGNFLDLKAMTNTFSVYSHDDACCCPTRGIVKSKLTIDDNGFRVLSSKYYPDLSE